MRRICLSGNGDGGLTRRSLRWRLRRGGVTLRSHVQTSNVKVIDVSVIMAGVIGGPRACRTTRGPQAKCCVSLRCGRAYIRTQLPFALGVRLGKMFDAGGRRAAINHYVRPQFLKRRQVLDGQTSPNTVHMFTAFDVHDQSAL